MLDPPGVVAELEGEAEQLEWWTRFHEEVERLPVEEREVVAGALPLRNHERVHLEARLNQPAHVYLLWIDSTGQLQPLYPWDPKQGFRQPPPAQEAAAVVHSPPEVNRGWRVSGPSGLETALLLVRRTPLQGDVDLAAEMGKFPASRFTDAREVNWLEVVPGQGTARLARTLRRSLAVGEDPAEIDRPALTLLERLRKHFELIKAVRFAHQGE